MADFNAAAAPVCAVVVTFNRCALLRDCLRALQSQSRPVETVLVVDNASTDNTRAMLREEFPAVEVLALPDNRGGAGGFHAGMRRAFALGFDWLWIMDDDGVPASDCLQALIEANRNSDLDAVMVPVQRDSGGREYGFAAWRGLEENVTPEVMAGHEIEGEPVFHFVGPLIGREAVARAGLPDARFFIWFDDIEWALRLQKQRVRVQFVPAAVFEHDFGGKAKTVSLLGRQSVRADQPAWKDYYGARNTLYALTRKRRPLRDVLLFAAKVQGRGIIGDLMYEPDRWQRVGMRLRGLCDGALGRLGKRVNP